MKIDVDTKMGASLKSKRESLYMSIEEVASEVNVSPGYLGLVERGRRSLEFEQLGLLMEVLQMSMDDLIDEEVLLLEQGIRDSFQLFNKEDLNILFTVCNSLVRAKEELNPPKIICLYK